MVDLTQAIADLNASVVALGVAVTAGATAISTETAAITALQAQLAAGDTTPADAVAELETIVANINAQTAALTAAIPVTA